MSNDISLKGYAVIFGVLLLCCGGGSIYKANYHEHVATCTITDKDRTASSGKSGGSSARIYTEQCGVLSNEDSILRGKTRSADIQGQLQIGHTYRLRIVGWRFGLTSDFPNILAVEGEVAK